MADLLFYEDYAGSYVRATGSNAEVRTDPRTLGTGTSWSQSIGTVIQLTGWYYAVQDGGLYFQIAENLFVYTPPNDSTKWAFHATAPSKSSAQAQSVINKLIANNQRIYENNLLCARLQARMSTADKVTLYGLQKRLNERNAALSENVAIQSQSTSYPQGYIAWYSNLNSFYSNPGIGSITAYIIVTALVIAALSTAAYWAYNYYYEQSADDVKYSDDLTKKLTEQLDEQTYNQLMTETQGIVTKKGIQTKLASLGSTGKVLLFMGLGYILLPLLTKGSNQLNAYAAN